VSKRILLIDSDESFAQGLSSAINARGFSATMATNSEQGMTMAKQDSPDLIVVCVEAQPTNGYMLCTRLKKDDALKGIPVILTSANATADSFEKHKKLKTRAEEYLIKPFEPQVMLEKASQLLGVELPAEQVHEDEIVAMEDEPLGLGDLVQGEDEPISLSEADAAEAHSGQPEEALVVEEVEEVEVQEEHPAGDDDLDMFDKAFDSLGAPAVTPQAEGTQRFAAQPPAEPAHVEELSTEAPPSVEVAADDLHVPMVDDEVRSQLEARIAELEQALAERDAELEQAKKGAASSGEVQKLKEAKNRADKEVLRLKDELHGKEKELLEIQEQQTSLEGQAQQLKDDAVKREAAAKALQQRADALAAAAKKFERELTATREDAKKGSASSARVAELEKAHDDLRKKHEAAAGESEKLRGEHAAATGELEKLRAELETTRHELEGVRAELENLRTDLNAAAGEKDLLTEEREELKKQLEEAQVTAVANEDRAVKAYQKIKSDEKLREKTRKALEIALQLLQENASDEESEGAEKKSA
jgi:CheY-like chemotaxis protein